MKLIKKLLFWLLIAVGVAMLVFITMWWLNSPEPWDETSESAARLDQAPFELASIKLSFDDTTRSTPALGEFEGADSRSLNGTIWYPAGNSNNHPILVFSHGFGSYHRGSRHIAQYLAKNGYVVAAVDFPLSHTRSPAGSPQLLDIVNQPGDVTAVIDHLVGLNDNADHPLHQRLDVKKVGAFGLSLGGLTTALVSYHPDYTDHRIQAAVMMAPPLEAFSPVFFASNLKVKSLVFSGSMDLVVPEKANATQVQARHPQGWFLSLDKGSHLGFANVANPIRWMENPDDLGCAMMDRMLAKLELPDKWSKVLPNTQGVLRDVVVTPPCPEMPGQAMNGSHQQWLARIAIGAFFDMHLRDGERASKAKAFFTQTLSQENDDLSLTAPQTQRQ